MVETWYILEDGTAANPAEVAPDANGRLVHKNGVRVRLRANGVPASTHVDPEAERAKAAERATQSEKPAAKPETKAAAAPAKADTKTSAATEEKYNTREIKAKQ